MQSSINFADKKMSCLWKQICLYCTVLIVLLYPFVSAKDGSRLKLCGGDLKQERRLVFVNTLDGKISALDAKNGKILWTSNFNTGPILSSSIHDRELNNDGQWVRLIPSLNGSLYKFDGENLEMVPISADQLLHSPFLFSDDLVFSGAKELHSYGVLANTGEILYYSSVSESSNNTNREEYLGQDVLIVQRFQHTVRAVEARTGIERWNFSVGQYNLELIPPADDFCSNEEDATLDMEIKVIISEGLIWTVNKSKPTVRLWKYKFDSPIVAIWRKDTSNISIAPEKTLEEIDLFDSSQFIWESKDSTIKPNIYLGMHKRQLYVQENQKNSKYPQCFKYSLQPLPAAITAVTDTLPGKDNNGEISIYETNEEIEAKYALAVSVLYNSEYINGNGFYLYSTDQLTNDQQCNRNNSDTLLITGTEKSMLNYTEKEDDIPVQNILLLLYWWKEVLIFSFTIAFLLNFMLTQRLKARTTTDVMLPPLIVEKHIEIRRNDTINDDGENVNNFKSHYLTDFEPVDCLGKGGYGVVFEARNKIDDCNYAIKRIALSNSQDSKERVLREVKALAKLDHHNIVRYFHAWLECPPSGWQEEHDQQWIDKLKCSTDFLSEITQTETKSNHAVYIDISQTDQSSTGSACKDLRFNNMDANDDSFITFERSNEKQHDNDSIHIDTDIRYTNKSNFTFSSNTTETELSNVNEVDHSESIVFENTDNNTTAGENKRQKFSLDLSKTPNTQKSAKMFLYIQMQLCQRLSLREWLKQHTSRDISRVLNIFQQIVDAVEYVHLQGLIHRDLKPSNIFFAYDDKIKIGDFGLVTAMTEGCDRVHTPADENETVSLKNNVHTAYVGTHLYMSPEQMNGQTYNYKVDIYSLGIIFFELLTPFFTDMERVVALSNLKKSIFPKDFAENYPAEYDLLKMMLDENPAKRPTTLGIKAKPPLQNYERVSFNIDTDSKWHFELPQLSRHSSVTSSNSSSELPGNIN